MTYLKVDLAKCSGCLICMQVCSLVHFKEQNTSKSRIRIVTDYTPQSIYRYVFVCQHCGPDAPCIKACPENAIVWKDDHIEIDFEKCTSCRICEKVCPYNAVRFHPDYEYPLICDLCKTTDYNAPQCIKYCPMGAIKLIK